MIYSCCGYCIQLTRMRVPLMRFQVFVVFEGFPASLADDGGMSRTPGGGFGGALTPGTPETVGPERTAGEGHGPVEWTSWG